MLMGSLNPREVFAKTFERKLLDCRDTMALVDAKCNKGHSFRPYILKIAFGIFNIMAKNFTAYKNDEIHAFKKRSYSATSNSKRSK